MTGQTTGQPTGDRVLLSVNPMAGRGSVADRVERLAKILRRQFAVEIFTDLGQVAARANQYQAEGRLRALVGVGGDGTAAELVNRTVPGVPLTLFPAGTSNLLARYFRLPSDPDGICRLISSGSVTELDAGRANGRLFLLMVGCGFDAEVVEQVHEDRKTRSDGHINYLTYVKPIFRAIRSYRYPVIRVDCLDPCGQPNEEREESLAVRWAFLFNFGKYAWGLPLAPWADYKDGLLDLCAFRGDSWWDGVRYVIAAHLGGHRRLSDCDCRLGRRFRITSDEAVRYQLDGDPAGWLPLDVEVLPRRVTLIAPSPKREGNHEDKRGT